MDTQEQLDTVLKLLVASVWRAARPCGNSNHEQGVFNRTHNPRVGDMVMECSNFAARPIDRIGRLISVGDENPPVKAVDPDNYDEAEWGKPYPPYLEQTWRIQTIDGREFAWTNARFIVVHEDPFDR